MSSPAKIRRQDGRVKHSLLESVGASFEMNRLDMEDRVSCMRNKEDVAKAHSQYLKNSVVSPIQVSQARSVVNAWAQKHSRFKGSVNARQANRLREIEVVDLADVPHQPVTSSECCDLTYDETCPVVGCGMKFTQRDQHKTHNRQFSHSPCNPLLHLPDGILSEHALGYICPKCGEAFQRRLECQEHMVLSNHLCQLSPLSVCAYMCPQCLSFFPEKMRCHNHIEEAEHFNVAFPFKDDMKESKPCPKCIPVPTAFAVDFVSLTSQVSWTLLCIECGIVMDTSKTMRDHWRETDGQEDHIPMATTDVSPADVFAGYLSDKTCDTCFQIMLDPVPTSGSFHDCCQGYQGTVVDLKCRSLEEFVRRCGLTLENRKDQQTDRLILID